MSPRAACRLATLGFKHVYDYMPGKVDWMARGLPMEGDDAHEPRAIDLARHDVTTCRPDETIAGVLTRVAASRYGFALVISDDGVLLGRLRMATLEDHPNRLAADVMEPGPSTTRPDIAPAALADKLEKADLTFALLTDPEGRLLGIVHRSDVGPSRGQAPHGP